MTTVTAPHVTHLSDASGKVVKSLLVGKKVMEAVTGPTGGYVPGAANNAGQAIIGDVASHQLTAAELLYGIIRAAPTTAACAVGLPDAQLVIAALGEAAVPGYCFDVHISNGGTKAIQFRPGTYNNGTSATGTVALGTAKGFIQGEDAAIDTTTGAYLQVAAQSSATFRVLIRSIVSGSELICLY